MSKGGNSPAPVGLVIANVDLDGAPPCGGCSDDNDDVNVDNGPLLLMLLSSSSFSLSPLTLLLSCASPPSSPVPMDDDALTDIDDDDELEDELEDELADDADLSVRSGGLGDTDFLCDGGGITALDDGGADITGVDGSDDTGTDGDPDDEDELGDELGWLKGKEEEEEG